MLIKAYLSIYKEYSSFGLARPKNKNLRGNTTAITKYLSTTYPLEEE